MSTIVDLDFGGNSSVRVWQMKAKLECTIKMMSDAFCEIAETKKGIADMVTNYGEQYCA